MTEARLNDSNDSLNGGMNDALKELAQSFPQDVEWAHQSAAAMRDTLRELDAWQWPDAPDALQAPEAT